MDGPRDDDTIEVKGLHRALAPYIFYNSERHLTMD